MPLFIYLKRNFCLAVVMIAAYGGLSVPVKAADQLDAGAVRMLEVAAAQGESVFRTVLETALTAWPEKRLLLLRKSKEIESQWLATDEIEEIAWAEEAVEQEEARQRARGLFYYIDPSLWGGQAELGGGTTTGDTSEKAVSLALHFNRNFGTQWSHALDLAVDFARRQGATSRESYVFDYNLQFRPRDRLYYFNFTRFEVDKFSGFDYRFIDTLGLGYDVLVRQKQALSIELGAGVRLNKLEDTGEGRAEYLTRASLAYRLQLSSALELLNNSTVLYGTESFTFENTVGLNAKINSALTARFSFGVDYESDTPAETAAFDTVTRVTLVYDF